MELMKGGHLSDLIKTKRIHNEKFSDDEASTIMRCILEAVAYLHS